MKMSKKIREILSGILTSLRFVWDSSPLWLVLNLLLQLVNGVFPVLLLFLLKRMVDAVAQAAGGEGNYSRILIVIVLTGLVTLGSHITGALAQWISREQGRRVTDYMTGMLLEKSETLDYQFFEDSKKLDSLQRAQEQAASRPRMIVNSLAGILQNAISLAGVLWIIARFNPLIILVLFLASLPGLVNRLFFSSKEYRRERDCTVKERRSFYYQFMMLERDYAKEVRLFHLGRTIMERFYKGREELRKIRNELDARRTLYTIISNTFMVILVFSAYIWVGKDVVKGQVSVGDFVMFYQAFQRGQGFLRGALNGMTSLYSHNLFLRNLFEFLNDEPQIVSPENPVMLKCPLKGGIVFENVSFTYPRSQNKVLDNLSLEIGEGEVVALVGLNGCGKTTLVKLLCRLYEVNDGAIKIDGYDIRQMNLQDLRENVGVIFQDFVKYNLTLRENIHIGDWNSPLDRKRLEEAVNLAGAEDLVENLDEGYDTFLGVLFEHGKELSGGQWQKVAMARAFYKDSGIIVLDEPTSSLDPKAELEVFSRFKSMVTRKTALLISHRMATVRMADRICVMDKGRIAEEGTHDELMEKKGLYFELFNLQAENYR